MSTLILLAALQGAAVATLYFLREKLPRTWINFRDSVTDNFRTISPKYFLFMT